MSARLGRSATSIAKVKKMPINSPHKSGNDVDLAGKSAVKVISYLIAVCVLAEAMLLWNTWHRVHDATAYQQYLVTDTAESTAARITATLTELRMNLKLIGEREFRLLRHLSEHPEDTENFNSFKNMVLAAFPDALSVALARGNGELLVRDGSGVLSERCTDAIGRVPTDQQLPEIEIHADSRGTHIDLLASADVRLRQPIVLALAFSMDLISSVLVSGQLRGHRFLLSNRHDPNRIEATPVKLSTVIKDGHHYLAPEETAQVQYRVNVEGTVWDLIVLPESEGLSVVAEMWMETLIVSCLMVGLCIAACFPLWRSSRQLVGSEAALRAQRSQLAAQEVEMLVERRRVNGLLERMTDAFLAVDVRWTITSVNRHSEEVFGLRRAELIGKNLWEALPELSGAFYRKLRESMDLQSTAQIVGYYPPRDRWLDLRTDTGAAEMAIFCRDVTESVVRANKFAENEARMRVVLDTAADGIIIIDSLGTIKQVNRSAQKLFGYTDTELLDSNVDLLMPQRFVARHRHQLGEHEAFKKHRELGVTRELVGLRKDGTEFPLELSLGQFIQGGARYYTGMVRDIEQRKRTEEKARQALVAQLAAEQANEAKSAFLAHISHEVRTPLTAMIGFAESLLGPDSGLEERLRRIRTIIRSGKHLLQIINDILDFSKMQAGKRDLESVIVHVPSLLADVQGFVETFASEKGIAFQILLHSQIPETVIADPVALKQVLANLCGNAVKFTEKGHVHLTVGFDPSTARLHFEVADTGIGMSIEQRKRIFQPFAQADNSIARRFGGTGLGLAISARLVGLMGGRLECESEVAAGSRFMFDCSIGTIPQAAWIDHLLPSPRFDHRNSNSSAVPAMRVSGRILIAEDREELQELLRVYLGATGAQINFVSNGAEALRLLNAGTFDLVLLDINMPVMSGLDAIRELRRLDYNGVIYAVTANASLEDRKCYLSAGFNGVVIKPFQQEELMRIIGETLPRTSEHFETQQIIRSTLIDEQPEFADLVYRFVEKLPATMLRIDEAIGIEDWPDSLKDLHDLKGMGTAFGYPAITQIAADMYIQITNADYAAARALALRLRNTIDRMQRGLKPLESESNTRISPQKEKQVSP